MRLGEFARVVRSKNAGPLWITVDVLLADASDYERALAALTPERVAAAQGWAAEDVRVIGHRQARAIKVVAPREVVAGAPGDRDVYGAQQHTALLGLEL